MPNRKRKRPTDNTTKGKVDVLQPDNSLGETTQQPLDKSVNEDSETQSAGVRSSDIEVERAGENGKMETSNKETAETLDNNLNSKNSDCSETNEIDSEDQFKDTFTSEAELNLSDKPSKDLTGPERNELYEKAETFFQSKKLELALKYYLQCIKGIERGSGFSYLPQCLHQIAEVYHQKDDDEKGIQFLKAEKIYYETALIDTKEMQKRIEELGAEDDNENPAQSDGMRAVEYENLARLCLEKQQSQLALEFSGKATKLYQEVYGDNHPATQRSLNLFTSTYAEVGKEEYTELLQKYTDNPEQTESLKTRDESVEESPSTELRKRKKSNQDKTNPNPEIEPENSDAVDTQPAPELFSTTFLMTIMIICLVASAILFTYVYCQISRTSTSCHYWRSEIRTYLDRMRYMWYRLNKAKNN